VPAILSNICFFLFTITDAVFIGRGIGTNALGAMNLINRFILVMGAVNMLISIGGVAIYAVRIGRGDVEDANKIFRHGMLLAACVSAVFSFVGVFFTDEVCIMLGAGILFTVMRQIICSAIPFVLFPLIYIRHYNSIAVMTAHLDW
jgi:Na+-driven multidrug efflux pump